MKTAVFSKQRTQQNLIESDTAYEDLPQSAKAPFNYLLQGVHELLLWLDNC